MLAALLAATGCTTPAPLSGAGGIGAAVVSDRLFFGRAIPGGDEVTDAQWAAFVAEEIAPRFPQGFTIYQARGHWRGDDGMPVSEPTMVVEIVHPLAASADAAVNQIATNYRTRFRQEAVLRVRTSAEESLIRQ